MPFFSRDDFRGVPSSLARRPWKQFELFLDRALGERVRADGACGVDLWCALCNVEWQGPEGRAISYSYRQAGDLVAWIREDGSGLEWYNSGKAGIVADWIARELAGVGWLPVLPGPGGQVGVGRCDDAAPDGHNPGR
jgi:hypothetical protein